MSPTEVHDDSAAWRLLLEQEMTAVPAGAAIGADGMGDREPVIPTRTATGRYIHIDARLRGEVNVTGLLCARAGSRIILTDLECTSFVTFHTDNAMSVTVQYLDPPEDDTP